MSYRTLVVHLDTSLRAHPRLELAIALARQFGAHLTGVFALYTPNPRSLDVMSGTSGYFEAHMQLRAERRGALERLFHAELKRAQVPGEWVATDQAATFAVPRLGRCADLIIAGQDDPEDPEAYVGDNFAANLVLSAGRPVLLVPYAGSVEPAGTHVMVAWDGSREAARAVHDALPFIRAATRITVVAVNAAHRDTTTRIPAADIAMAIARHGVHVETRDITVDPEASIGDTLLSEAAGLGADLLVMGGYGHTRWLELVLGGATRTVMQSMTLPVLLSH
ncbi:universal stress protein [Paraburkholderia bryophila]|uniref:Universal stress protein family protein n=1 Tax=Paraburkholderia bryophila TaxID=420952 RepID=A0A329BIJ9_9BURK|nr:universal stress protein [Paraburkholderia bryophila]RAS21091.1 universal stress protein family protein [Paraburkholderia bryophila]